MYDVIVIGAGAMGSSSAYFLAKKGMRVALVEQFKLGHTKGSSHGESRIIRMAYPQKHFAEMMPESYRLWEEIQREAGKKLLRVTGGLDFGKESDTNLQSVRETLEKMEVPHEILDPQQLRERFPGLRIYDGDMGVYQKDAGILNASLAVRTLQELANSLGAEIFEEVTIENIEKTERGFMVSGKGLDAEGTKLVVATGAWTKKLLGSAFSITPDYEVWRPSYAFWRIKKDVYRDFPIFICWDEEVFYGFPENEQEGAMKVAIHISEEVPRVDPDEPDAVPQDRVLAKISDFVTRRFSGLHPSSDDVTNCLYSMTPDENFIIDEVRPGVVVAAGFSGHGFKFTPVIGRIVSDMITGSDPYYDLTPFAMRKEN